MLKRLSPRETLVALLAEFEPLIQQAFLDAIDDLRSGVAIMALIEHLERKDVQGALDALHLDKAVYSRIDEAIRATFAGGGRATVDAMPTLRDPNGAKAVIRFDAQAFRAVEWARQHALAPRMVEIDKEAARILIVDGIAKGRGARRTALDLAGRINRATGRRSGGAIGLSVPQVEHVVSMRERLSSGDPSEMRKVLEMGRRDARFDRTIAKAIEAGVPVPAEAIDRMTARYSDRLLELRGRTIARTEGMAAFNAAAVEAYEQAIEKGAVNEADLEKTWRASMRNTRHTHVALNGQKVGFRAEFVSPSGARLKFPHDPDAPPAERVNCQCRMEITIDFLARFRGRG